MAKQPFSFNNFPDEVKEMILCSAGPDFHHVFMSVSRDWHNIISGYRRRHKMPHVRKLNINTFYPYSIDYMVWSIDKNNLSPAMMYKQIIKKGSIDIIKWFTMKYNKIIEDEIHVFLAHEMEWNKENIITIITQRNNLDIFKWIYENFVWGKRETVCGEVMRYVKNCCIEQHKTILLKYLLSDHRITFNKCHFMSAIHEKFTEGVKLLHKEYYYNDVYMMNIAFAYNTNIETVQWLISKNYICNDAYYSEYLSRQL